MIRNVTNSGMLMQNSSAIDPFLLKEGGIEMKSDTILCVGYARLPEGTTMEEVFKIFGVGLEIEPQSGNIVRAQTTCATILGNDFLTSFFVGKNAGTDSKVILEQIQGRYLGHGSKAILAATKKAFAEYSHYKNEGNEYPG